MELDKIITGDSAVVLQSFPPDCIDLTVTSPPYDNLRTYNGFTFDFETIARELFRVTKEGGVVVWVVGDATVNGSETLTSFKQAIRFQEIGFSVHDTMIYQKDSYNAIPSNRYFQVFEYMFILSKGSPKTFNGLRQKTKWQAKGQSATQREKDGTTSQFKYERGKATRLLDNVWNFSAGYMRTTTDKIAYEHPAMFPEALARDHIESWSNIGDIVLDCFCGSGTTPKKAKELSRHYLGIEISPEYVALAERRLLATNVPLFGQGRGLTLPAPDAGKSAASQALSTPDMFSTIEHEPTPAPRR